MKKKYCKKKKEIGKKEERETEIETKSDRREGGRSGKVEVEKEERKGSRAEEREQSGERLLLC